MDPIISGIQQVGVGVPDVYGAWGWYNRILGFDVPVFDDRGTADKMLRYTGGEPQGRHAVLAVNMQGGGGLEIWQYTSRKPQPPNFQLQAGDLGIFITRIKTRDIGKAYRYMDGMHADIPGRIEKGPEGIKAFHIKDPYGNIFRIEEYSLSFMKTSSVTGGIIGVVIGVSGMEASIGFYREILGFDRVIYDEKGTFPDMEAIPGGSGMYRRVLLEHRKPRQGAFSRLLGSASIELVQALDRQPVKIFENRYWGDQGYMHLCFDIRGMSDMRRLCRDKGYPFTVDSNPGVIGGESGSFDMGEAAGHFSYVEDPDGTLIEFVEAHKIPVIKKIGWYMDLRKREPDKPLPDWMLKTLRWNRKK